MRVYVEGPRPAVRTHLAFAHDNGSLEAATRRCVGVGACLSGSGNVMCPSYRATGEEQHSTRGRARLLFEFASGRAGVDAAHADARETERDARQLRLDVGDLRDRDSLRHASTAG